MLGSFSFETISFDHFEAMANHYKLRMKVILIEQFIVNLLVSNQRVEILVGSCALVSKLERFIMTEQA